MSAGVVTLLVATLGGLWLGGVFEKEPVAAPVANDCTWNQQNVSANPNLKDVGTPKTTGIPAGGTSTMTINFASGPVVVDLDRTLARCASESLAYLAGSNYFNDTKCHEIVDGALRCGDHSGTGDGGAAYTWVPENVPAPAPTATPSPSADPSAPPTPEASPTPETSPSAPVVRYPAGTVAMQPGLTGSQFLIFYEDSSVAADYSIVGTVRAGGLDVISKIADAGTVDNGKPKDDVIIQSLTVVDPDSLPQSTPSTEPTTDPSAAPTATETPSATPGS